MPVHSQLIDKNRPITLIVWALVRVEKTTKKGQKCKKKFFVANKYQDVTHVSTFIFQGLFENIVFRILFIKSLGDSVKTESARAKKLDWGGQGCQTPPSPCL